MALTRKAVSKEFSKTRLLITLFSTTLVYFWIIAAYLVSPRSAFFYFHVVSVFNWLAQKCRLCSKTLIRTATGTLSYIYQSQNRIRLNWITICLAPPSVPCTIQVTRVTCSSSCIILRQLFENAQRKSLRLNSFYTFQNTSLKVKVTQTSLCCVS